MSFDVLAIPIALAVFGVIIFLSLYFSAAQRMRRAMRAAPRRRIAEVIEGELVRVVGTAEPLGAQPLLRAPLSGRACLHWQVLVQEYRKRGKSGRWVTVVDESEGLDFALREQSARALVKGSFAKLLLEKDHKSTSGFLRDASPELEAFLADRGRSSQGFIFNKSMRYLEGVLEPQEWVCVVGVGRWERDPDASAAPGQGYREVVQPRRLVIDAPESGPLLLSDETKMID